MTRADPHAPAYVFGYGSLALTCATPVIHARGLRRTWGVAMDNRATQPGYKYYINPATGARPEVHVVFLDIVDACGTVNGLLLGPLGAPELDALDDRERNYDRIDLSDRIVEAVHGVVWAYRGTDAARRRCGDALADGSAVVDLAYRDGIEAAFRALGPDAYAEFAASTDPPACEVRPLRRIDVGEC